jgi:geranylgeranyl reductase family protein
MADRSADVLVIGAGPAGAATAYWLASHGHDVVVVERRTLPRDKTCGDALTPRAVHQLIEMGLGDVVDGFHHTSGIRFTADERDLEVPWPSHPVYPAHGIVARRRDLDTLVARRAEAAGAQLLVGHEATLPVVRRGFVRGATVTDPDGRPLEIRARFTVVADGANSRFGRALGTFRTKEWPYATAIRGHWRSSRSEERWLESALDLRDRDGTPMPGYAWVFPEGDGTVNVGVGILSTFRDFKSVNTSHLLRDHVERIAESWGLEPSAPEAPAVSGRIPMGASVGPAAGPTYLVVGDAAGVANPFSGDGIGPAYETGRLAATVLDEALTGHDATAIQRYPKLVADTFGEYYQLGRLFDRLLGHPKVMRAFGSTAVRSDATTAALVRIMTGSLRTGELGAAEAVYRLGRAIAKVAPKA